MRVSRSLSLCVRVVALVCILVIIAAPVFAQQADQAQKVPDGPKPQQHTDYSKPAPTYSIVGPYKGKSVPPPVLANTPKVSQLLREGKLMLSLNDAITLALENNLDLAIARYNNDIADTDILRANSGGSTRGVNTGLVSGTPGGGGVGSTGSSGGGAGGTTTGAGGAGAGSGGIVASTLGAGPSIDSFDPIVTGNLQFERARFAVSNFVTTGVPNINQNTTNGNFTYTQGFQTGSLLNLSFNNSRTTTSSPNSFLNPSLSSSFRATVRQHLLNGCCLFINRRNIISAHNNKQISDIAFQNQVITTVSQIQNIYWDLVNAYEDYRVKERSLQLAQKTFSDNQKQVQIGTLAPIEVVRAQSAVSAAQQDLIISQTNLQLQQLLMKNAITRNLKDSADLANAPVIPTDSMTTNLPADQIRPVQDLVADALKRRPDIISQRIDLKNRDISRKSTRNALLPTLDLVGFYGGAGLAGSPQTCVTNPDLTVTCTPGATNPGTGLPVPFTGFGSAFGDQFNSSNPDKGVALQLTIPIRNRAAQADQVRSELEYRQAEMRLQQLENQISIEVRNAQYAVQQNRARVDAARAAREFQQQSLDAEQKKYALGASTNTLVLQAQRDLTQSEVNVVAAEAAFEKSQVELDRVTGYTLDRLGIIMTDAMSGQVTREPRVPGVVPAGSVTAQPAPQQQQPPQ